MSWTEDEYRKAGMVQKKLRLRAEDAENLAAVAKTLGMNQSEAVAELCRRFLKLPKR